MSDTPRTDALVERNKPLDNLEAHNRMLDHARQLERDLAAANAENAKLRKHAEAMADAKHVYDWETHAAAYRADFPKETDHDK